MTTTELTIEQGTTQVDFSPAVVPFTVDDARMIQETHMMLSQILDVVAGVLPMLEGMKDSPIGKMLGI